MTLKEQLTEEMQCDHLKFFKIRKVLHFHFGHIMCCFTRLHLFWPVCSESEHSR